MASLFAQPHQNYKENIELLLRTIRNQVEWKSDNYRIKKTTYAKIGRRGQMQNGLVSQPHAVDKNPGGDILGASKPRTTPGLGLQ